MLTFQGRASRKQVTVDLETQESKRSSELFLEDELKSTIRILPGVFATDVKKSTDDEVADRRNNLSKQTEKFINMTKLIT